MSIHACPRSSWGPKQIVSMGGSLGIHSSYKGQATEQLPDSCGQCWRLVSVRKTWRLFWKLVGWPGTAYPPWNIVRAVSPLDSTSLKTPRTKFLRRGDMYTDLQPRIFQKLVKPIWPVLVHAFQSHSCIHIFPHTCGDASKLLYDVSIVYLSCSLAGGGISTTAEYMIIVFVCFQGQKQVNFAFLHAYLFNH